MERVSCGAAVCSEWASCSLLILVSQCPLSSQALPKRRTGTASLHCTQWQSLHLRGVPFRGDQQAPGKLGRPYARIRAVLLLLHRSFSSGHSPPPFNPTTSPGWPGTASLRVASGPPGRCWWARRPSLAALRVACWQWHVGLLTEHRRGAERSMVEQCSQTSVDLCGAAEGQPQSRGVESNGCLYFVSERKDRCIQTEHKDITEQLSAVS